jgi:hypothetical protein
MKHFLHSLLKPGVSGLLAGLCILSRSPSSLVCPSIDSSFAGGDSEAQAGLDESVRKESLPVPPVPLDELLPEPKSKPLNLENFYQSSRITTTPAAAPKYSLDLNRNPNTLEERKQKAVRDSTEMVSRKLRRFRMD